MPPIPDSPEEYDSELNGAPDPRYKDKTILVVTESPVNRIVIGGIITRLGFGHQVSGFSAIDFDQGKPAAVVIDCTGDLQCCSAVLDGMKQETRPKVLMITGGGQPNGLPVDIYVSKPVTSDKLEAAIHALLET